MEQKGVIVGKKNGNGRRIWFVAGWCDYKHKFVNAGKVVNYCSEKRKCEHLKLCVIRQMKDLQKYERRFKEKRY